MTDADLQAFEAIARNSCGEPGRVLQAVADFMRKRRAGIQRKDRSVPTGQTLRRACQIIQMIERETGKSITGRSRGGMDQIAVARHGAMRRLRDLGLSTPWIARLLDLESHATVVMALQQHAGEPAEE